MYLDQIVKIEGFQTILHSLVDVIDIGIHIIDIKAEPLFITKKWLKLKEWNQKKY